MTSRLVQIQARFQQKQIQEREEKLLRMYENQQQKAYERVGGRSSAGSNKSTTESGNSNGGGGGKVRQMFDERRQKAGVDRSYPLEPLKTIKSTTTTTMNRRGGRCDSDDRNQIIVKTQKTTIKLQQRNSNNNNNNNNNNKQHYLEEDNNYCIKSNRDIVEMMNKHNLNGFSLDDEQMPNGFNDNDDDDAVIDDNNFTRKLVNVGSWKLPNNEKKKCNDFGKTFRRDIKPIMKKTTTTIRPASGSIQRAKVTSNSSPPSSKTANEIMPVNSPLHNQTSKNRMTSSSSSTTPKTSSSSSSSSNTSTSTTMRQRQSKQLIKTNGLSECKYCNRRFASDRLEVHENICMKTGKKKRKIYDATKHRIEGTELEPYVRNKGSKINNRVKSQQAAVVTPPPPPPPKKDWRRTHEEFINTIRAAKQAQAYVAKGGKLSDLPPPPPSTNPDYIQCLHCGRKFNQTAAERHIPKCATFQFNKPKPGVSKVQGKGRF